MYDHVNASVANVYEQIAELQSSIQSTNQHLLDTITQIGTLNNELSARITALEGRVESEEQQTSGIWAHIETLISWVNFIGGMLSRIEEILVTLGLL
jgi:peptidoglycan hydrolase CwlO-like protein